MTSSSATPSGAADRSSSLLYARRPGRHRRRPAVPGVHRSGGRLGRSRVTAARRDGCRAGRTAAGHGQCLSRAAPGRRLHPPPQLGTRRGDRARRSRAGRPGVDVPRRQPLLLRGVRAIVGAGDAGRRPPRRRRQGRRHEPTGRPAAASRAAPRRADAPSTAALDAAASSTTHRSSPTSGRIVACCSDWAGEIDAAEADTRRALDLYESQGWTKRAADLRHNLAWLAARRGDLVESFRRFDAAEQVYTSLGVSSASVFPDRAEALLAAGLTSEALAVAERSVQGLQAQGDDVDAAEALMLVARAALLAGDVDRAAAAAGEATGAVRGPGPCGLVGGGGVATCRSPPSVPESPISTDATLIDTVIAATESAGLTAASADARVVAAELAAARGDVDTAGASPGCHGGWARARRPLSPRPRGSAAPGQRWTSGGRPASLRSHRRRVRLAHVGARRHRASGTRRHARCRGRRARRRPRRAQR